MKKTIIITGCSSGIGAWLARSLNENNEYHVLASARDEKDLQKLSDDNIDCHYLELNDSESIKSFYQWALEKSDNKIYALINNAAYGQPGAVEDLSREALKEQFETNVFGTHELTCLVMQNMRGHNEGRIIQISSILGLCCLPYRGAYNASKFALEALTDTMRLESTGSNIKFALIEPGPIRSRFRETSKKQFLENIDYENSYHTKYYNHVIKRLKSSKEMKFTLGPEALMPAVKNALEAKNPKVRQTITVPAHILARLKRFMPAKWLDAIISRKFHE